MVSPGTSFDIVYTIFRTAQWSRSDNAYCHPYNDQVAKGAGAKEEGVGGGGGNSMRTGRGWSSKFSKTTPKSDLIRVWHSIF